ncbi:MAG TPA: hypothetical protein VMI06_16895 [Terriglobia bacterium]|nr:hypothetical protein [Terriglobia bacterium]
MNQTQKSAGKRTGGESEGRRPAGLEDPGPKKQLPLPVWFFVGIIFMIYGVMILVTGLLEFSHPPHTVLWRLHPAIWWGAVILLVGVFFAARHRRRD